MITQAGISRSQSNAHLADNVNQPANTNTISNSSFSNGGSIYNLQSNLLQLLLSLVQQLLTQFTRQSADNNQSQTSQAVPQQQAGTTTAPATTTPATTTPATTTPATTTPATTTPATAPTTTPATNPATPTAVAGQKVIDVYLLGGQSNAVGLGSARLEKALEKSLGADTAQHQTNVFSYAAGATNLFSQWKADGTASAANDGIQYKTFQSKLDAYMASLRKANPDAQINIAGMFWHQGESDALSTQANRDQYDENLTRFIQDVRTTTKTDDLPFMIGRLSDNQTAMKPASRSDIQKAQDSVGAADPWAITVDMSTAQTSGIHFTTKGYEEMARLFATAYKTGFVP